MTLAGKNVSQSFCDERFQRVSDMFVNIDKKVDGLKTDIANINRDKEESSHFWRNFAGSSVGGIIVGVAVYIVTKVPH